MSGKLVGGVWLPETETHLAEVMTGKDARLVEGKATYQYKKLEACLRHLGAARRRLAVDIGAHVGLWSMWLVREFSLVHAFEPIPAHRELFRRNVQAHNFVLHACALGAEAGEVALRVPLETTGNAHIAIEGRHPGTRFVAHPDRHERVEGVPLKRLDDLELEEVDFIKIDVEGYERQVLAGAWETIRRDRPILIVEQKGNDAAYGDAPNAAVKQLERWGMRPLEVISGDWIMGWPA